MSLYLVTFEAEVSTQVEAECERDAERIAQEIFSRQDVVLTDVIDIDLISGGDEE